MMQDYQKVADKIFVPHYSRQRPFDWDKEFEDFQPLHIEIGFGHGEFLLRGVLEQPEIPHVGLEIDWGRIRKCLKKIARLPEPEQETVRRSLRIFHIDAWVMMQRLIPPRMAGNIVSLFPCPWPKECHERHRLFSQEFLRLCNSRLRDQGTLYIVTDDGRYADWIDAQSMQTGLELNRSAVSAQYDTKFERKWVSGGQQDFCALALTKKNHCDIPLQEDAPLKAYYHDHFSPEKFLLAENVADDIAVIPKEWLYDAQQQKGAVRVVVAEAHLTQHLWVAIVKTQRGWCVLRSEGQQVLPTPGVARAIALVSEAVQQTAANPKL